MIHEAHNLLAVLVITAIERVQAVMIVLQRVTQPEKVRVGILRADPVGQTVDHIADGGRKDVED